MSSNTTTIPSGGSTQHRPSTGRPRPPFPLLNYPRALQPSLCLARLLLACRHPRVQKWVRQSAHRTEPRTRLKCLPVHQLPVPFCSSGTLSPFTHFLCRCWQDLEQRREPDAPQVNTAFLWQPWRAHSFRGRASAVLTHLVSFLFPHRAPPFTSFSRRSAALSAACSVAACSLFCSSWADAFSAYAFSTASAISRPRGVLIRISLSLRISRSTASSSGERLLRTYCEISAVHTALKSVSVRTVRLSTVFSSTGGWGLYRNMRCATCKMDQGFISI